MKPADGIKTPPTFAGAASLPATVLRVCRRGHIITTENARYRRSGRRGWPICRECERIHFSNRASNSSRTLTEDQARQVLDALNEGKTLTAITQGIDASIVDATAGNKRPYVGRICELPNLKNFCRSNPRFGAIVEKLARRNRLAACERGVQKRRTRPAAAIRSQRGRAAALLAVQRATTKLCETIREEVRGDMLVAIATNRLRPADAASRLSEFVAAVNRANRHSVFSKFGSLSLDMPLSADSKTTLGDTLTQGLWGS